MKNNATIMAMHRLNPAAELEKAIDKCKEKGLRITGQRRTLLKVLAAEHGPFTAEEVHKKMRSKDCDVVTVYRNLTAMESIGVLKRCDFGDGAIRYELLHDQHHHHHIICTNCKKVEPLEDCKLDRLNEMASKKGFKDVSHSLEFFGLCKDCA